jgi:hypothetical protein
LVVAAKQFRLLEKILPFHSGAVESGGGDLFDKSSPPILPCIGWRNCPYSGFNVAESKTLP